MKTLLLYFLFAAGLLLPLGIYGQTWTQKTSCPFPGNEGGGTFVIDSKIYFASGKDKSFYQYDPKTDVWTKKADLPGAATNRTYLTAFAIDGMGYVGLGIDGAGTMLSDFWQYDPVANSWSQKANYPGGGRIQAGSFVINSKGYVGGGTDRFGVYYNDFYEYSPSTNTWTQKADAGGGAYPGVAAVATFAVGGYGYFIGGDNLTTEYHIVVQYDPVNDIWTKKKSYPGNTRVAASGFSYGNLGYIGFGETGFTTGYDNFYSYDPSKDTWQLLTEFPPKTGRAYAVASVVGNKVYLGAGWDIGSKELDDWWELSLPYHASVPNISTSVQEINFGQISTSSSADSTITIHAGADTALMISNITISGLSKASFSIKNVPAMPFSLEAGKDLVLTVSFKPIDTGMATAKVEITSNAGLEAAHSTSIQLQGSAISLTPHLSLSSMSIGFGTIKTGTAIDSILTITAGANVAVEISNILFSAVGGVFALKNAPTFPLSIAAGKSQKFTITFKPIAAQHYNDTLIITSNAEGDASHTTKVVLQGEGSNTDDVAIDNTKPMAIALTASPNPFLANLSVDITNNNYTSKELEIRIIDELGKTIIPLGRVTYVPGRHTIDVNAEHLSPGKYWVIATTAGQLISIPLIKSE